MLRTKTTSQSGTQQQGRVKMSKGILAEHTGCEAGWLTRERRLVLDVDVLVLSVPFNGFLQTFEALHEGQNCYGITCCKRWTGQRGGVRNQCEEREGRFRGEHM